MRCCRIHGRRLYVAFALGVLITVGLAWAGMALPRGNDWYGPLLDDDLGLWKTDDGSTIYQLTRGDNDWHTVVGYWHMQISGRSMMIPTADYEARRFDFRTLPGHLRPDSLDGLYMQAWYHETGWPFGALSCAVHWKEQVRNADIIYRVEGGFQLPRDAEFNPRVLPWRPVWPGFAIDVLFWGGACWFIMWVITAARRGWRRRGNRCQRCGYSRQGLAVDAACPECGLVRDSDAK